MHAVNAQITVHLVLVKVHVTNVMMGTSWLLMTTVKRVCVKFVIQHVKLVQVHQLLAHHVPLDSL